MPEAAETCLVCGSRKTRLVGPADARYGLWACPGCSFAFTLPRPSVAELAAFYNEQDDYNRLPTPLAPAQAARRAGEWDRRIRRVHPQARRVLEIGCQHGALLFGLKQRGYDVTGADLCDTVRQFAGRHYGITVHAGAFPPEGQAGTFDVVILSHVIEHVLDPVAFLTEAARFLAPGGVVCIETPGLDTILFDCFGPRYNMVRPPEHISFFTRRAMPALFARCGLETVRAATMTRPWSQPNPYLYALLSLARASGGLDWLRRRRNPEAQGSSAASMKAGPGSLLSRGVTVADYATRLASVATWPLLAAVDAAGKGLFLFAIGRKKA